MSTLDKLHYFFDKTLMRQEFYEVYSVMTALAGPASGDYILVGDQLESLKHVVRVMRITVMGERFGIEYAKPYTQETIAPEIRHLKHIYPNLKDKGEKEAAAKVIKALEIIERWLV